MKIAMLCPRTPRLHFSGIEQITLNLSKQISSVGNDVCILTTSSQPCETNGEVRIQEFPAFSPQNSYFLSIHLYRALLKDDSDLIHCNGYDNLVTLAAVLAKRKKQRLVIMLESAGSSSRFRKTLKKPFTFLINRLRHRIDAIICVSESEYNLFRTQLLIPKSKFFLVPNGVDKKLFDSINERKEGGRVICMGRLVKNKGYQRVIRGLAVAIEKVPNVHLKIIGEGPYEHELRRLAANMGLTDKVQFHGVIPFSMRIQLIRELKRSSLFCLLSDYESSPLVVLESIAAGTPLLVSNQGIMKEFADKGYAMQVYNPDDPQEVGGKMALILSSPDKFSPPKEIAVDWREVARQLVEIYNKI